MTHREAEQQCVLDHANGLQAMDPRDINGQPRPEAQSVLLAAAQMLRNHAALLAQQTPEGWKDLERLCEAATPGPWTLSGCSHGGAILRRGVEEPREARHPQGSLQIVPESDAAFIAAARTAVPELLRALKGKLDWQPIETAPKDGAGYLVFPTPLFGADQAGVAYWDRDEGYECWRDLEGERLDPQPTHWMPLPAAPREEAK